MFQELLKEIKGIKMEQRKVLDELVKSREEITELKMENKKLKTRLEKVEKGMERTERAEKEQCSIKRNQLRREN